MERVKEIDQGNRVLMGLNQEYGIKSSWLDSLCAKSGGIMTTSERKAFCQIIEYLNDANYANLLLAEELHDDPHKLLMSKKTAQTGKPNKEILVYAFHGVGCFIETKDYQIDFDYNSDGKIKTFNSFMVFQHSKKKKTYIAENDFELAYEALRKKNIIRKSADISGKEDELSVPIEWI